MARKPTKGYFVRGQFVAAGSVLDEQLKAERKGGEGVRSRADMKRESDALQRLGEDLPGLRADLLAALQLPENLVEALHEIQRITHFEGRRRQAQFIGRLMRKLDEQTLQDIHAALEEQRQGSAAETLLLHNIEQWRVRLLDDDGNLAQWMQSHPQTDVQRLRSLVRQARKDAAPSSLPGQARRQGRAYRELFAFLREQLIAWPAA